MLRELHIRNFSIIVDASLVFDSGFNVLTGETGAGKSIVIKALALALGERASSDTVRTGAEEAIVEAFFDISPDALPVSTARIIDENGIPLEEGLIIRRTVNIQGRSRAYINGAMVNVQTLSDITRGLIDIHGQYEHQSLLSPEHQLELLDSYGGLSGQRQKVLDAYTRITALQQKIDKLTKQDQDRAQRIDILRFQTSEIESSGLTPGEEKELEEKVRILGNAVRLAELSHKAYDALYGSDESCMSSLSGILLSLKEISDIDPAASDAVAAIEQAIPLLEETTYFLRDYKDRIDFRPEELEAVQTRIEQISRLRRKYGKDIDEIIAYNCRAGDELKELLGSEENLNTMTSEHAALKQDLTDACTRLSKQRAKAAKTLEQKIEKELSELDM